VNKPTAAETIRAAISRSKWLIIASLIVGVVAVNVLRQAQGPQYEAKADVLVSTTDLGSVLTDTQSSFVDPERVLDTERNLAESFSLYAQVAETTRGELGTAEEIKKATTVSASPTANILTFTASESDSPKAIETANAVATEYVPWRAGISGRRIDRAISELRAEIRQQGANSELSQQLNKLLVLKTVNSGNASVVNRAVDSTQTRPTPVQDSLIGLSIGIVVALLLVGAREAFDTTARSEEEVEGILETPVIASIPALPRRARIVTIGRHEAEYSGPFGLLIERVEQSREGTGPRVIAVTSATGKEGKSSTAANLAVGLARHGTKVVIADLDLANPSLGQMFHVPTPEGDAPVSMNGSGPELWSIRLDDGTHGIPVRNGIVDENGGSLRVLPARAAMASDKRPLKRHVSELLSSLRDRADWVVIDTPPALRSAEMTALAREVDMVLVVVRQGHVTRRNLRSLAAQLRAWPARTVGAVLTDVHRTQPYSSTQRSI
jgi:tyrosine-protein kinase